MAYTTIDKPTDYFRIKTYTGNATNDTAITFDESTNMKPDWLWIKNRSAAQFHAVFDSTRGATLRLSTNGTGADSTENTNLDSFDTNGFTVDNEAIVNGSGNSMVAWSWKANGGTTSSNSDGSITSTVQANTTAGFSIVSYTGSSANSNVGTVGHGLGTAPKLLIIKDRDATSDWIVFHGDVGTNKQLDLNNTGAEVTNTNTWNNTAPSSSVFTIGNNSYVNNDGNDFIAYCFAEKKGYSKFGSFIGNQSTDGTFIFTGFKPAWIMFKESTGSASGDNWFMFDNKRSTFNQTQKYLKANSNVAEDDNSAAAIDMLSNGFKIRTSDTSLNDSGETYIYMAFAESPFVNSNGVPNNAR
jgi:hypothetical protein